jgi:hypothetical protein
MSFDPEMYFPKVPPVPNMPMAPSEWGRSYQDQFTNILRLYLNQVTGLLRSITGVRGGRYIGFPFGAFYDSTRQTAASTTVAYTIPMTYTYDTSGVSVENGTKLQVSAPGVYNLGVSLQLANSTNASQDIDVWFRKNGVDIANSNSRMGLPARKSPSDPAHSLMTIPFVIDMRTGDYVEFVWRTTDVGAYIEAYSAGTSPTRPAIPSVIVNMAFASAPL